jgi:alkylation response protein AidB-like acyl-CoA dehydrogenase
VNFELTDDQQALRDAVARWAQKSHTFERRHALAKAGGASHEVLGELADLGLLGLQIPSEHGGLGMGPVEAMVVTEELGRAMVSAPYADAALMAPLLLAQAPAPVQAAWLPKMVEGKALVVVAHQEHAARYQHTDATRTTTQAQVAGQRHTLKGRKLAVHAGDEAHAFVVPAVLNGSLGLWLVEAADAQVKGYPTQDGARAADLILNDSPATLITLQGSDALALALDVGIAAACAEGVGLMDRMLAVTVEYMNTRKQFGSPLAGFQALRHRIADVKMQVELARSMSYFATLKLQEPATSRRRSLSQAKVQLGHSMRFVGQQCIQLHGGIGVTDEYISSHLFKRLTMLEMAYGDTLHHLGEVNALMQDTAGVFA